MDDDPSKLSNYYHDKMTTSYNESQMAWNEGRKGDAKKHSVEMKVYKEKMMEYRQKAKEMKEKGKLDKEMNVSEQIEKLISTEILKMNQYSDDLEVFKTLNEEYAFKMKQYFDDSQNFFKIGKKEEARYSSLFGKAYKILVEFSNNHAKYIKNTHSSKIKQLTDQQLRELIKSNISKINDENVESLSEEGRYMANHYSDEMIKHFNLAQVAWANNDKKAAKIYSDLGSQYKEYMTYYNQIAAKNAFIRNNVDKNSIRELDLHGLTISEASTILDEKIKQCLNDKVNELTVIFGKGLHSGEKGPKLKSFVIEYVNQKFIPYVIHTENDGCIILYL